MQSLNEYQIKKELTETDSFCYKLASHHDYSLPVVLKTTKEAQTSRMGVESLKYEYDRLRRINHPSVIRVHSLEKAGKQTFLVREYFKGETLQSYLDSVSNLNYRSFLPLAVQMSEALEALHKKNIVHGRLSAKTFLIDPQTQAIKLIGLGNQFKEPDDRVFRDYQLQFTAPELSRHTIKTPSFETDIYALGVVFFLMLSGRYPFESDDAMALAHRLLAQNAPDLKELAHQIPEGLSDLVAKMLKKLPEERYPDASALNENLQQANRILQTESDLNKFEVELENNVQSTAEAEVHLYGRSSIIKHLHSLLDQQLESGKSAFIEVYGTSGVGKSSLIENVLHQIEWSAEQTLKVKFDQYKQALPFEMLYESLRAHIRLILTQEKSLISEWKKRLSHELKDQAQVLYDAIPELEWLTGSLPQAVTLPPADTKTRLDQLLRRLIQAIAQPQQPLILVMDDIQWSDAETLDWLATALEEISGLIVLGAYRDNEIDGQHSLSTLQKHLHEKHISHEQIALKELSRSTVSEMVAAFAPVENIEAVSDLLYEKTGGNAFFVTQYLKQLQQDRVLFFDHQHKKWVADFERLKNFPACDSVVDLLSERMTNSSEDVIKVLKTASCIGNRFEYALLKEVGSRDEKIDQALQKAQEEGWITVDFQTEGSVPLKYQFSHDRIQQAVWSSMSENEKAQQHLRIGEVLRTSYQPLESERLYECVNHLNKAQILLETTETRRDLAELNLSAGIAAKQSGGFETARSYLRKALELVPSLARHPKRTDFLRERAECEHLCHNDETALNYYQKALESSDGPLTKARVYELIVTFHTDLSDYREAYRTGRLAISQFGVDLPEKFNPLLFVKDLLFLHIKLRRYQVMDLLELPEAKDEAIVMTVRLLSVTLKAAYQVRPELCVAVSLKVMKLCLAHGNTREAVIGYIVFGIIFQSGVLGRHLKGYEFGELSLALLKRFSNQLQTAEVEFVFGYFAHSWLKPAVETEALWHSAYHHGREIGDWFHTGCAAAGIIQSQFMRGLPLNKIKAEIDRFRPVLKRIGADEQWGAILSVHQAIENLRGATESQVSFSQPEFDETEYVQNLQNYGSKHFALYYFVNKMATLYHHQRYSEAEEVRQSSIVYLADAKGMRHATEHLFYSALIEAKRLPQKTLDFPIRRKSVVENALTSFQRWSQECPENFLARHRILEGEVERLKGHWEKAIYCYDSAIEASTIHEQFNLLYIANKLAADLYSARCLNRATEGYRQASQKALVRWGAGGDSIQSSQQSALEVSVYDVMTLLKATEVIAKEQNLPALLKTLIRILIENAGAQRGLLLMYEETELLVQAEASVYSETSTVMQQEPYTENLNLVPAIVHYVMHSGESIVLDNATKSSLFSRDKVVVKRGVMSVMCVPLKLHGEEKGMIYLENNSMPGVFTSDRTEMIRLLSGHIAIAIDNARIHANLEHKVEERTQDLDKKNETLEKRNKELKDQNARIVELNELVVKENEQRKKVENQLHEAIETLNQLAITDPLTNLHNRRSLDEFLKQECDRVGRHKSSLALILCDIDFFKNYNDHFGHQQGDACLKQVSEVLIESVLRPSDFIARYGGEEFAIVMPETDLEGGKQIAERIHNKLAEQMISHPYSKVSSQVTMSIGLTASKGESCNPEILIKRADQMLYKAKSMGRNRTVIDQED